MRFYEPGDQGYEATVRERLEAWWGKANAAGNASDADGARRDADAAGNAHADAHADAGCAHPGPGPSHARCSPRKGRGGAQ